MTGEAISITKETFTTGVVFGSYLVLMSVIFFWVIKDTDFFSDSLGGNSKTIIIANISPSNCCALETLSTLKFAQRAKFIRNNVSISSLHRSFRRDRGKEAALKALAAGKQAAEQLDRISLTWDTSAKEENEFLRMQEIQNQKEVDALRKNLTFCLEAKEKLESYFIKLVLDKKYALPPTIIGG